MALMKCPRLLSPALKRWDFLPCLLLLDSVVEGEEEMSLVCSSTALHSPNFHFWKVTLTVCHSASNCFCFLSVSSFRFRLMAASCDTRPVTNGKLQSSFASSTRPWLSIFRSDLYDLELNTNKIITVGHFHVYSDTEGDNMSHHVYSVTSMLSYTQLVLLKESTDLPTSVIRL